MAGYVFIHNMVGYLPEADPEVYETWEDAKSAALDYLNREGDFYFDTGVEPGLTWADECSAEAEDLNLITQVSGANRPEVALSVRASWSTIIGNIAYSIEYDPAAEQEDYED